MARKTVSYIGGASALATSVTIPVHAIGDLLIIAAYAASATIPTLGAGFTSLSTAVNGTALASRIGYKIATATNDASGTWTNAGVVHSTIYRNTIVPIVASNTGTGTAVGYPALTLRDSAWVSRHALQVGTSNVNAAAVSGFTLRYGDGNGANFDSNGIISSLTSTTQTTTGTGAWITWSVELQPAWLPTGRATGRVPVVRSSVY